MRRMATADHPTNGSDIKVCVIGTGSLGKEHVRIYSELHKTRQANFVGLYDVARDTAQRFADKYGVRAYGSVDEAVQASDAISIVTPTTTHFSLAREALLRGKHLFVEKPMTDSATQAAELVQLAQQNNCLLQVGHVERFNPVFKYLESVATEPRFIETHRLSPYPSRSTDIGVVLDLMIHDLDIVLAFANGCVANLTASRISPEKMRKIRVFSSGPIVSYISLDYRAQEGFIYRIARDGEEESSILKKLLRAKDSTIVSEFGGKRIVREPVPIEKEEPLKLELQHFVECVRARRTPVVSGESAKQALDLAFEITRQAQQITSLPES
jgi:predicted dehydrogenase